MSRFYLALTTLVFVLVITACRNAAGPSLAVTNSVTSNFNSEQATNQVVTNTAPRLTEMPTATTKPMVATTLPAPTTPSIHLPPAASPTFTPFPSSTAPPTFIPVLPQISNQKCLSSESASGSAIIGVWYRNRPYQPNEHERYYFRSDNTVTVWLGGHTSDGKGIEPLILNGEFQLPGPKQVKIHVLHWPFSWLRYGICGDRLVMQDMTDENAGLMAFVRLAEWCWDNPASYPKECYGAYRP